MARKSRNALNAVQVTDKDMALAKKYQTAVYARLSKEREDTRDRGTIFNQISLIKNYIKEQDDMEIYKIYMDDDITGTSFERPAFNRMMEDMRKGRIGCIVVKDLSRLGRDYVEAGNLLERVFPMFGIRFVSISEHYDSLRSGLDLMIPVTNIANALYAQDISKKIKSSKENKMKQGIPVGHIVYGYKAVLDENGNREMAVDEESGEIVRRIFREAYDGRTNLEIAVSLNEDGVDTPYQYRYRDNPDKLAEKPYLRWTHQMIYTILRKEVYTGKYVMGKDTVCLYRYEKRHTVSEDDCYVFEDHHEPLVTKEVFKELNKDRKKNTKRKSSFINLLKRKVVCGCCGSRMHIHPEDYGRVYMCNHRKTYGKDSCACMPVKMEDVYETVFSVLKESMQLFLDENEIIREMNRSEKGRERKQVLTEAVGRHLKEIEKCRELKRGLYQDYLDKLLDEKDYIKFNREYSERIDKLTEEMNELQSAAEKYEKSPAEGKELIEIIRSYRSKRKLSKELVDAFVDKVIIYENKNMEVVLKFEGELKELEDLRKRREAELA